MKKLTPIHQFEIRYSNILNFPHVMREVFAPFVKLADRVKIENENSHQEKLNLSFDEEEYIITATWDRIILKKEGVNQDLAENNSIVESPFLDMFSRLKEVKEFGEIANFLYYSFNVNIIERPLEEIKSKFFSQRLQESFVNKIPNISDVGLNMEFGNDKNGRIHLSVGPYLGIEDIRKRGLNLVYPIPEELEKIGEIVEFRYFEGGKKFSFAKYKEIKKIEDTYLDKLWLY